MHVPAGGAERSWTAEGERPRQLRDLVHAGAYVMDDRGLIVEVNAQAERLLRRSAAELLGRDAHDLLHRGRYGERLPRIRCAIQETFITGATRQGTQEWFERGDGSLMPTSWLATACRSHGGRPGALVLFYETVSPEVVEREPVRSAAVMSQLEQLALLAETTTSLTASLDVAETLHRLVRLVAPLLADWVVVDLHTEEGDLVRAMVVHHKDGALARRKELEGPMPPVPPASPMPLSRALRGVAAMLVGPQDYQGPPDSGIAIAQRELFRVTGMHSACIVPIRGVREVIGALTLGRSARSEPFTAADLPLAEDIAHRAGLALENARLHERQRRVAETMQRHLLPRLPQVPGLEMTARYLPAPRASQVGGDWYDAFVLADGATGLVIGDVVGHDLDAAAGMAQVCNMLRAYAGEQERSPSTVVDRLDQAVARMAQVTLATAVFARVERAAGGWRLRWTNAGHPPPLLVEPGGRARFLEDGGGLLLGTGLPTSRQDAVADLPLRSTLLLYTDGLIESPGRSLDEGMARLLRYAAALAGRPLNPFCDVLLSGVRPAANIDDVALLALRLPADAADTAGIATAATAAATAGAARAARAAGAV